MSPALFALDAEQACVFDHGSGPLLVTGPPGSGKSAVLRERFVRLIEEGADPERVSLVVHNRRTRRRTRELLLRRLDRPLPGLRVVTVHALAFDVIGRRFGALGYDAPPAVLSADDQFSRVRDLLGGEDPGDWPAYGRMLGLRGFADEVRQFLTRAQEALLAPEDVLVRADAMGLSGWRELGLFYRRYLDVMYARAEVDFAGLLAQASTAENADGPGDPLYDHVLVDDYQEATFAMERLLAGLRPASLVVAGDDGSHIFSFRGTTDEPLRRFASTFPGGGHVVLGGHHRTQGRREPSVEAWRSLHTSEEHAAIARELRRVHVKDGVPWPEMAVVVRRQGTDLGGLLRALDDAGVPRGTPQGGLALLAEPATFPYLLALRWLARPNERDGLAESVLTSDLGGLSPAAARSLVRAAASSGRAPADALEIDAGLSPEETTGVRALNEALAEAETVAARSVLDAFAILWRRLPCSRRLVDAPEADSPGGGNRDLRAVGALADAVSRAGERADASTAAFLDLVEAGEEGPGVSPDRDDENTGVRVVTAHAVAGDEFDTVVVAGFIEGNFPSLSRPEPMFDLRVLDRSVSQSERNRLRLEDERRLFGVVTTRARRRTLLTASDPQTDDELLGIRSRFVAEAGSTWSPAPAGPFDQPLSVAEAAASWRRRVARADASPASRLAAIDGLLAIGARPAAWWFQRDWTDPGEPLHESLRVSYSRLDTLENCALQFVLAEELGLEDRAGYHAWVGSLVHQLIEDCEAGLVRRTEEALTAAVQERWNPEEFPSLAVSEAFRTSVLSTIIPGWLREYGESPALAQELRFEFEFEGATVSGYIDRVGKAEDGSIITDYKTGKKSNAAPADDNLQLGIYYLAVNTAPELKQYLPVKAVELAFLKQRSYGIVARTGLPLTSKVAPDYERRMRDRLGGLIGRVRELSQNETYRPSPAANCFHCRFKPLCPMYTEGQDVIPVEAAP
jgi:superfamily I DNA/RNA helicase/RecB family exonuclease